MQNADLVVYVNGEEVDRHEVTPGTWAAQDFAVDLRNHWEEFYPEADIRVVLEE